MPECKSFTDDNKLTAYYAAYDGRSLYGSNFIWFTDNDEAALEHLRRQRKHTVNLMQEMSAVQKSCGRENPEATRWFSQFVKQLQKHERAYTLVLQHLEGTNPRDEYSLKHWPVDLVEYLDHARNIYELARAGTFIGNGF